MALLQSEVLDLVEKAKTKEEKINLLRVHETPVLRALMRLNFDTNVEMDLPEGEPPFNKESNKPMGYELTNLTNEYKRFYIWLDNTVNIPKVKKERLFIEMLEGLHPTEAEILCLAKDKKLTKRYKTIKEDLVREAFPYTLPPKTDKKEGSSSPLVVS